VRLSILAAFVMLAIPAFANELFRYRGAAKDGGTLEFVFEAGEQNSPNAVTKEKAAEIAADFMTTFYHIQIGALETQEFRTTPGSVLASFLLRHNQRTDASNVLRRSAVGWDGCCAQSGEAAVVSVAGDSPSNLGIRQNRQMNRA
jgi:hypothetical protein